MSSESKQYAVMAVYREGVQLTEETQITISRDFGNKAVRTVARAFAGTVKTGGSTRISIRNAVPAAGVEYDPGPDGDSAEPVQFTFIRGGQQMTLKAVVETDSTEHGVDNETTMNFDLLGPLALWDIL